MAKRMVITSPPFTGACDFSQLVAPASFQVSKPVPGESPGPLGQYGFGGEGHGPPFRMQLCAYVLMVLCAQTSKNPRLTLTGLFMLSNEMLPLSEPIGGGVTSAMNWSL